LGYALHYVASTLDNPVEKKKLYLDAIKKYKTAIKLNPRYFYAYEDWGRTLGEMAKIEEDETKKKELMGESFENYRRAFKVRHGIDKPVNVTPDDDNYDGRDSYRQ
jgi:tetratricopeptide (TPR) repeat protein